MANSVKRGNCINCQPIRGPPFPFPCPSPRPLLHKQFQNATQHAVRCVECTLDKFAQFFGQQKKCMPLGRLEKASSSSSSVRRLICKLVGLSGREAGVGGVPWARAARKFQVAAQRSRLKAPHGTTNNQQPTTNNDNDNEFIRQVFACFQYLLSF